VAGFDLETGHPVLPGCGRVGAWARGAWGVGRGAWGVGHAPIDSGGDSRRAFRNHRRMHRRGDRRWRDRFDQ